MENGRRIDASAEPDAEGNIRNQVFANGILQERVQFFLGGFKLETLGNAKRYFPVRLRGNLAVDPLQPFARRKFLDAFH